MDKIWVYGDGVKGSWEGERETVKAWKQKDAEWGRKQTMAKLGQH